MVFLLEYGAELGFGTLILLLIGWLAMKVNSLEKKEAERRITCDRRHFDVDKKYNRVLDMLTATNLKLERAVTLLEERTVHV